MSTKPGVNGLSERNVDSKRSNTGSSQLLGSIQTMKKRLMLFLSLLMLAMIIVLTYGAFGELPQTKVNVLHDGSGLSRPLFEDGEANNGTSHLPAGSASGKTDVIRITSWTSKIYNGKPWWKEPFSHCTLPKGVRCTYEHTRKDPLASDVILFRASKFGTLPQRRSSNQKYLIYERESQVFRRRDWSRFDNVFNGSVGFIKEADVNYHYGFCEKTPTEGGYDPRKNYAEGKTKPVAWLVSHCRTQNHREEYIQELQKHIPVDIYGGCGRKCGGKSSRHCETLVQRSYKFYLAFENSFCKDYFTEKLFRSLKQGLVPIVFGYVDYDSILPPHSFINAKDFKSPKHLAEHLKRLDSSDTLYNEYFKWRDTHRCQEYVRDKLPCDICEYAHRTRHQSNVIQYSKIWNYKQDCISAETFRKQCNCWPQV